MSDRHIRLSIVTSADGQSCAPECPHHTYCFSYEDDDLPVGFVCYAFDPYERTPRKIDARHPACIDAELANQDATAHKSNDALVLSRDDVEQVLLWAIDKDKCRCSENVMRRMHAFAHGPRKFDAWLDAACDEHLLDNDTLDTDGESCTHAAAAEHEVTELRRELARERALREDAEAKLARLGAHARRQNDSLREERTALRKGQSTTAKRVEEVMRERDAAVEREARLRAKLARVRALCTGWHRLAYLAADVLAIIDERSE